MSALPNAGSLIYSGFGRSIAGGMDLDNNGYNGILKLLLALSSLLCTAILQLYLILYFYFAHKTS